MLEKVFSYYLNDALDKNTLCVLFLLYSLSKIDINIGAWHVKEIFITRHATPWIIAYTVVKSTRQGKGHSRKMSSVGQEYSMCSL